MTNSNRPDRARDGVAVILALGISTAINIIVLGVLYDAFTVPGNGISENGTQLLTMALGGIIGVLGSYVGGRNATQAQETAAQAPPPTVDPPPEAPPLDGDDVNP